MLATAAPACALLGEVVALVATSLFSGMVVELVADVQDGRRDATPAQLLRAVAPVLGSLILVAVVAGVLIVRRPDPDHRPGPDPDDDLVGGDPARS